MEVVHISMSEWETKITDMNSISKVEGLVQAYS